MLRFSFRGDEILKVQNLRVTRGGGSRPPLLQRRRLRPQTAERCLITGLTGRKVATIPPGSADANQDAFLWFNSMLLSTFTGRVMNEAVSSPGRIHLTADTHNGGFQEVASRKDESSPLFPVRLSWGVSARFSRGVMDLWEERRLPSRCSGARFSSSSIAPLLQYLEGSQGRGGVGGGVDYSQQVGIKLSWVRFPAPSRCSALKVKSGN